MAHWFPLVVVLSLVFRSIREWRILFKINIGVCLAVAMLGVAQHYDIRIIPLFEFLRATPRVETTLAAIHETLAARLAERGVRLDRVLHCPHHPTQGAPPWRTACACRKPAPGMILQAARELDLDLAGSWIVGDSERDLAAGAAAGVPGILVATGKGAEEHRRLVAESRPPEHFVADMGAAARLILSAESYLWHNA